MQFRLMNISGVDDAIISLFMSKRSYTPELADEIRANVRFHSDPYGRIQIPEGTTCDPDTEQFANWLTKITKYGAQLGYKRNHETMLRFIDLSIETIGLHRGAQDDLDAHAQRMNNRIVRSSTRLARFSGGERSDFYKGKILTAGEMAERCCLVTLPQELDVCVPEDVYKKLGETIRTEHWKFNGYAYVRGDVYDDQDVQRGTYPLEIPSNCIWRCDFVNLKHIYSMRHLYSHANPELKDGIEQLADQVERDLPVIGMALRHEWVGGRWIHVDKVRFAADE